MQQKLLKSAHYIELGGFQSWPVLVPRGIRLYTYEQVPGSLRDNPYITDGYRAYLPSRLCLKSLFILSNETVNIWSHLLGFLLFFTLGIYDMTSVLPSASASREDFVICSICLFCFQVCMLCSVGYHLFSCHRSEKTCRRWMALDYAGISIGILGCYVSGVFYAFYCNNDSSTTSGPATRSGTSWPWSCCTGGTSPRCTSCGTGTARPAPTPPPTCDRRYGRSVRLLSNTRWGHVHPAKSEVPTSFWVILYKKWKNCIWGSRLLTALQTLKTTNLLLVQTELVGDQETSEQQ
ncbi:progestin and adipoQ receptor family member 3 isoform X2 [Lemur catta]|uniref:progestin and adipoQ receptor family member 3 isoform X2 n=1 Tax=Lemur catta TaxID=9447 RepID=UPI001E26805F|nr:progestin and adipoQ receptor family member 3 isoform X2 [Lemur catta]